MVGPALKRVPTSYGVPKSEVSGSQKGGIKVEVKRGKGVGEGTGPEGARGGKE